MASVSGNMSLAKSILQGALMRQDSDAPQLTRDDINRFHEKLEGTLQNCSHCDPEFLQCVAWIRTKVIPSRTRTGALGTYLVKLSTSMEIEKAASSLNPADPRLARHASKDDKPSAWYTSRDSDARGSSNARARLHLLNLLDLLFLTTNDTANLATVTSELEPPLVELIRLAAPVSGKQALDIHRALRKLLTHLETFYSRSEMLRIRSPARTAYGEWLDWLQKTNADAHKSLLKNTQVVNRSSSNLPELHGNHSDLWYHLPAACMIPHIKGRTSIRTALMAPLPVSSGLVDPELRSVVKDFVTASDRLFQGCEISSYAPGSSPKLNGIGLELVLNPTTGKREVKENYYGWSQKFCDEMKKRKANPLPPLKRRKIDLPRPPQQHGFVPPPMPPPPNGWVGQWPPAYGTPLPPPPPEAGGILLPPPSFPGMGPGGQYSANGSQGGRGQGWGRGGGGRGGGGGGRGGGWVRGRGGRSGRW